MFSRDLQRFRERTIKRYITIKRMSAFDLFSSIVLETPVDEGVLRNNWFASIEKPSDSKTDLSSKSGTNTITRIHSILQGTDEINDIFLTNNLPYAKPIEFDGHSGKAPDGMVRVNMLRWDAIVRANVRKFKNAR